MLDDDDLARIGMLADDESLVEKYRRAAKEVALASPAIKEYSKEELDARVKAYVEKTKGLLGSE